MKKLRTCAHESADNQSLLLRASLYYIQNSHAQEEVKKSIVICDGLLHSLDKQLGDITRDLSKLQCSFDKELLGVHKLYCGDMFKESTMSDVD